MASKEIIFNFFVNTKKDGSGKEWCQQNFNNVRIVAWFNTEEINGNRKDILLIQQEIEEFDGNGNKKRKDMLKLTKRIKKDGSCFYIGEYEGTPVNGNFYFDKSGRKRLMITYERKETQNNNDCGF